MNLSCLAYQILLVTGASASWAPPEQHLVYVSNYCLIVPVEYSLLKGNQTSCLILRRLPQNTRSNSYGISSVDGEDKPQPIDSVVGEQGPVRASHLYEKPSGNRENQGSVGNALPKKASAGKLLVGVERVMITRDSGEVNDISLGDSSSGRLGDSVDLEVFVVLDQERSL